MTDILYQIKDFSTQFNQKLPDLFVTPEGKEKRVSEAMLYSLMNGGKRIRPFLVTECARLFGKDEDFAFMAAASLEMLHTYSLIHDDLPAMDNDTLRRGKPTCHVAFDEATAILAGDGLLTYAFEVLSKADYENDMKVKLLGLLGRAAGAFDGMIAGQMLDLYAENAKDVENPLKLIEDIERMKTGCLLKYACEAGAILGDADEKSLNAIGIYARKIGQTFQISDDILDATGDQTKVGKTLKKDAVQNKLTFVSVLGLDEARKIERKLTDEAVDALSVFGEKAQTLQNLAEFIISRDF